MRLNSCFPLFLSLAVLTGTGLRSVFAENAEFHLPQTEAEQVLDKIFRLENFDRNLLSFVLETPWYDPVKDTGYAQLFTKTLLKAYRAKQVEQVLLTCSGDYFADDPCGFDYDPIFCGQDRPDLFAYRTMKIGKDFVVLTVDEPPVVREVSRSSYYRLVKESDVWKLDGVSCQGGDTFNMPSAP